MIKIQEIKKYILKNYNRILIDEFKKTFPRYFLGILVNGIQSIFHFAIPFIDVGRVDKLGKMDSIVSTLDDWGAGIDDWVGEAPDDYWKAPTMDMMNVGEAYNNGYSAGQDLENWIGNLGNNLGIDTMADEMKGMASAAGAPNVKGGKLDKIGGEV